MFNLHSIRFRCFYHPDGQQNHKNQDRRLIEECRAYSPWHYMNEIIPGPNGPGSGVPGLQPLDLVTTR